MGDVREALLHVSDHGTPPDEATPDGTIPYRFNFLTQRHSIKPPWKHSWGNTTYEFTGTQPVRMTEELIERTYCVSYAGGVHYYEVTDQTLDVLSKVRERVYVAFDQAADPDFYQCPYCGSRDLQEVYGRRVYKCARCNDRLVTDEEFMYARTGRLRKKARRALLALIAWRAAQFIES